MEIKMTLPHIGTSKASLVLGMPSTHINTHSDLKQTFYLCCLRTKLGQHLKHMHSPLELINSKKKDYQQNMKTFLHL